MPSGGVLAESLREHRSQAVAGVAPTLGTLGSNPASSTATAETRLSITNVAFFKTSACHPAWAAGLGVEPPGQSTEKVVPLMFRDCAWRVPMMAVQAARTS